MPRTTSTNARQWHIIDGPRRDGPYTQSKITAWLEEGVVPPSTVASPVGSIQQKPLAEWPEFASALANATMAPPPLDPSPVSPLPPAAALGASGQMPYAVTTTKDDCSEPLVLTLGRGLAQLKLSVLLRGAILLVGAFAITSLVQGLLLLWSNPVWQDFARVLSPVFTLGVFYFLADGILALMAAGDSNAVRMSVGVGGVFREWRDKLFTVLHVGGPILGLEVAWLLLVLAAMIPNLGPILLVAGWPIRLAARVALWLLMVKMLTMTVIAPVVKYARPEIKHAAAAETAWKLVRRNVFYWTECVFWIVVVVSVVTWGVNYLVAVEQGTSIYATGIDNALSLYGGAPTLLKAMLVVPGLESPFTGVSAPEGAGFWSAVMSSVLAVLHFVLLYPVSALLFLVVLYPVREATRRLLHRTSSAGEPVA
jgi:hypothetical protein